MRKVISLNGDDWRLRQAFPGKGIQEGFYKGGVWERDGCWDRGWYKVEVPGDVHSSLFKLGVIDDPYFGMNNEKIKWISDYEWWYRKTIHLSKYREDFKNKRIKLAFYGVDYEADFWFNGVKIGNNVGMFSKLTFDITEIVKHSSSKSTIAVCLSPPPKNRIKVGGKKSSLGYSLDYNPELITVGIWEDVELVLLDLIYIHSIHIIPKLDVKTGNADIVVRAKIVSEAVTEKEVKAIFEISGFNFKSKTIPFVLIKQIRPGNNLIEAKFKLTNPRLWWPNEMGKQNIYSVKVSLFEGEKCLDIVEEKFGIKEVKLVKNEGAPENSPPWVFIVNGKRVFIKGANWTCTDMMWGNLSRERYERFLFLAKEANINMLRIHGHHIREKKEFYDICDEYGIMIWQEFPFGNAVYPDNKEFLEGVRKEIIEIIRTIRNHPCVTLYAAGNELPYEKNYKLMQFLEGLCEENDPGKIYLYSSDNNFDMISGRHNWNVWHGQGCKGLPSISEYENDKSTFVSEFGLQSIPEISSLKRFIPKDELRSYGLSWEYHFAQFEKLKFYASSLIPSEDIETLEGFIRGSQRAQGEGLKFAIEHYRRRKYKTGGCLFWAFNEPWPEISWSIVDWYGRPKLSYYFVKNAYSPVLTSMKYSKRIWKAGNKFCGEVWVINDLDVSFENCTLEIKITNGEGRVLEEFSFIVNIEKDSSRKIGVLKWKVPSQFIGLFKLILYLWDAKGRIISENNYSFISQ